MIATRFFTMIQNSDLRCGPTGRRLKDKLSPAFIVLQYGAASSVATAMINSKVYLFFNARCGAAFGGAVALGLLFIIYVPLLLFFNYEC